MTTQHDEAIKTVAHVLYDALRPETSPPYWLCERAAVAIASLSATPAPSDEVARLREALIAAGRNAGALLADDVSTDFLMLIPAEVEARIARLREALARMVTTYADMQDGDGEPCPDVAFARAALGPEVGEG